MQNNETTAGGMVSVSIEETIDRTELFGGMDKNLKLVEEEYGVDVIQRDNSLLIKGERPEEAAKVLEEMIAVLGGHETLDEQKINYIEDLNKEGRSFKEENPGKSVICFTHDGKPLRAKTAGQEGYVETIRRRDVVFGIGPAGTGKTYTYIQTMYELNRLYGWS
ncbi:MAG: PhoH family protein, partial [Firmicutes bacterium]|nr:PhoH family protein [Bacillota bacterium]